MQATVDDMVALLKLQQVDLERLRAKKRLDELPQRAVILDAREKKRAIGQKRDQVERLRAEAEAKAGKLEDEDASQSEKQRQVQQAIDEAKGDYRNVEARTKELDGIAKRRAAIEAELARLGEELAKIKGVADQVALALAEVEQREAAAVASFQDEGGALQNDIARLAAEGAALRGHLPEALRDAYERVAARSGGVAVGRLEDGRCGVCRAAIEQGRLADVKAQAPLATCPHCKRLLIVR